MTENKPRRLSDIVEPLAPEGANDARWYMIGHQLIQAKMSIDSACSTLSEVAHNPESANERKVAWDCYDMVKSLCLDILEHYAAFLSYLSGTDVPERIARKEL